MVKHVLRVDLHPKNLFVTHPLCRFSYDIAFSFRSVLKLLRLIKKKMLIKRLFIFLSIFTCVLSSSVNQTRLKRDNEVCGFPSQVTSLIIGGDSFQRGTWPWMVAMMRKTMSPPKFFCGGILVSLNKVLTGT